VATQPVFPPGPSTKQRHRFEKDVIALLAELVRPTAWKRRQNSLFIQSGDHLQSAFLSVHANSQETHVELSFKPMAIDPVLWEIMDMADNRRQPLSFRVWGAFTCSPLPIANAQIERPGSSPADVAHSMLTFCEDNQDRFRELLVQAPFSELVAKHPNQVERGAYAVTLVVSLIHERELAAARRTAQAYASGEKSSTCDLSSRGESFHQLALKWLDRMH
jgi:hypothetical protein